MREMRDAIASGTFAGWAHGWLARHREAEEPVA